ncbi:UNVERIFIED_CONTAM: hypothetical protein H355_007696 [Colinus virginianus]|nr:hypothetical protein H355_007696 [Colinus virginianus]
MSPYGICWSKNHLFFGLVSFWGQNLCNLRGCCWSPQSDTSVPWCFFSSDHGYRVEGELRETQQGEHRDPKSEFSLRLGVGLSFGLIRMWVGFGLISDFPQGFQATLTRLSSPSLFGDDINTVLLTAEYQTQNRFHFKVRSLGLLSVLPQLTDPASARFEVPHEHIGPFSGSAASDPKYSVSVQHNPFGIKVTRVSTGKVV